MGRTPQVAGGRPVVVTIRLSEAEARALDAARRGLTRSEFGRMAINRASNRAKTL